MLDQNLNLFQTQGSGPISVPKKVIGGSLILAPLVNQADVGIFTPLGNISGLFFEGSVFLALRK